MLYSWVFCYWMVLLGLLADASRESFIKNTLGPLRSYPEPVIQVHQVPASCELQQIQLVARHGKKFPTVGWYSKFRELESHLQKHNEVLKRTNPYLAQWKVPLNDEMIGQSTKSGLEEMRKMAVRMKGRHPDFFSTLTPEDIIVRSSNMSRTIESAAALIGGLYGDASTFLIEVLVKMLTQSCQRYCDVHNGMTHDSSSHSRVLQVSAAERIDLDLRNSGKQEHIQYILTQLPTLEVAVFDMFDGVCTLFNKDEFLVREVLKDLSVYYDYGYGFDINVDRMCSLVTDLLETAIGGKNYTVLLRFTHTAAMAALAAALGFFADPPPALSHVHHPSSRAWRSSFIGPYGANLQIETYQCHGQNKVSPYVRMLWNERTRFHKMKIPYCNDSKHTLCPLDKVLAAYV
ncbi:hypothetical protein SmJEL517_g01367 [Synchytrium microbalum]|uniref:Multiple inositol polyphosphate phosphatase 1 n=1 Tax=Synchytrium microbalum TaxID=1806994 RepID=A0A507CFA3_9FUNG|nr:uncharacterized protein SmJEL517_g01367 [Synchytrium microbalum]TPX36666.1 hypothetical protein SmJEL517_g01367 [Synchytrium microbalum]